MSKDNCDKNLKTKGLIRKLWVPVAWLAIWQLVSMRVNSTILLASPFKVLASLWELLFTGELYTSVLFSLGRITLGFCLAVLLGTGLGALSYSFRRVREFIQLPVSVIKATPVASFIIIVLIWVPARNISVVIAFLMAFPVIYTNVLQGLMSQDDKLLEMAKVFEIPMGRTVRYIYVPQVIPFFRAACEIALAMSWKAGIAAEVIGLARGSIGEQLYQAKIYLETPRVLAWTIVIVAVSFGFERLFLLLIELGLGCLQGRNVRVDQGASDTDNEFRIIHGDTVTVQNVYKTFDDIKVLERFSHSFVAGSVTCILGRSGVGKTTLLRLILGLETPDAGIIDLKGQRAAVVFQEDRLCENLTAWLNLRMVVDRESEDGKDLTAERLERGRRLLIRAGLDPEDTRPVSEYSGGMKRRVALVRALSMDRPLLIMDEPLTGLDEETGELCLELIREASVGRTVIMVTHDIGEAEALEAEVINLTT